MIFNIHMKVLKHLAVQLQLNKWMFGGQNVGIPTTVLWRQLAPITIFRL